MLTNAAVNNARPAAQPYKLHDVGGLHLIVRPTGSKSWRMKFRRGGKEQLLTIGSWPEVSLVDARAQRDQARERLDRGELPPKMTGRPVDVYVNFEALARAWYEQRKSRWSLEHAVDVIATLERDVFPAIGAKDPRVISANDVLELLLKVEERGCIETARRLRERISGVFRFGVPRSACREDPASIIGDELSPRPVQEKMPAITDIGGLQQLLGDVDRCDWNRVVKLASRLLALTAVRQGALRGGRWDEIEGIDWTAMHIAAPECIIEPIAAYWTIPAARMKLTKVRKADPDRNHVVPLSRQAIAALLELRQLTGGGELMFPGRRRGRPIGEGAIGDLYNEVGYAGRHVPHGWRAAFSTVLNTEFPADRSLIDQALAHVAHKGRVEAAYNRSLQLVPMADLFQRWADLIMPAADGTSETIDHR